jgi:hypothetical protein
VSSFDLDVQACPNCGGRLRLIATIVDRRTIRALLLSLGMRAGVAERAPPIPPPLAGGRTCLAPPPDPFTPILTRDPATRTRPPRRVCFRPSCRPADLDLRPAPARPPRLTADSPVLYQAGAEQRATGRRGSGLSALSGGEAASENSLYVTCDPGGRAEIPLHVCER